jgi:hypothetical protein
MRTTLASVKSVQKIKSQDTSLLRVLKLPAFVAERAFLKVMALDLCNGKIIIRFDHRIARSHEITRSKLSATRRAKFQTTGTPKPPAHHAGIGPAWKHSSAQSSASATPSLAGLSLRPQ